MPGQQGVMPWPAGSANVSVLCEETLWPIETGRADKLIVLHGLETSERPSLLLDECHRVLGPGGRALFIVPNRAGLWARRDRTPYGFGRPYTLTQLETQLGRHGFEPERHAAALFQPPTEQRFWLRTGPFWERAGQRISNRYAGGVLLVEAVKHAHTPIRAGVPERVRRPLRVLDPHAPDRRPSRLTVATSQRLRRLRGVNLPATPAAILAWLRSAQFHKAHPMLVGRVRGKKTEGWMCPNRLRSRRASPRAMRRPSSNWRRMTTLSIRWNPMSTRLLRR